MDKTAFMEAVQEAVEQSTFVKLSLGKPDRKEEIEKVLIRHILLKGVSHLSMTLRYPTRDEVKNYDIPSAIGMLALWLGDRFLHATLMTTEADFHLLFNKKRRPRLLRKPPSQTALPSTQHNREKRRLVAADQQKYLHALGVTGVDGKVLKAGQRKFRQINKYIEILQGLLPPAVDDRPLRVVDMGSGKGYLTFALYDYLQNNAQRTARITGIELRPKLVELCNELAESCGYQGLDFVASDIHAYDTGPLDMLIALHACDIATDIAIAKGIRAGARTIIVAPCCHKQIRQQMNNQTALGAVLRHGILAERQAELVTDGLRALLLEQHGYRTKVFEFISTEHTAKNLMIVGIKSTPKPEMATQIEELKAQFGIEWHYLERLLE